MKRTAGFICLLVAMLAIPLGLGQIARRLGYIDDAVRISVDPKSRYQTLSGWEATAEIGEPGEHSPGLREQIYNRAVEEVGINRLRLEVRSGAENTNHAFPAYWQGQIPYAQWRPLRYPTLNDNDDPFVINPRGFDFSELDFNIETSVLPLQNRLSARGERLFVNLCYVAFIDQIEEGEYIHQDPEEYAEFVLAVYQHIQQKYGFSPDAWEVVLEPDLEGHWTGRQMGLAMKAAAARLRSNGFTPRFIVPSVTDMGDVISYLDGIDTVPGASDDIFEISYHRYRGVTPGRLRAIASRARSRKTPSAMLEWWFGNAGPSVLFDDLLIGENAAWQGRVLRGLFDIEDLGGGRLKVDLQPDVRQNAQVFRYARAGAVRIGASSTNQRRARPLAFVNVNGAMALSVRTNGAVALNVQGLPPGRYRWSYASATATSATSAVIGLQSGEGLRLQMPEAGVISVFDERAFPRTIASDELAAQGPSSSELRATTLSPPGVAVRAAHAAG